MSTLTNPQASTTRPAQTASRSGRTRRTDEAICQLVRRATDGDQRAWEQLVEEFAPLVWGVARAYGLNDADASDVSQFTWLRLVELEMLAADPAPSYAQISAALDMPCGSIGPTRARALERLRRQALRHGLNECER